MSLDELLGIDPNDPMERNARQLVAARHALVDELVLLRSVRMLSRADVAERLGCTVGRVAEIEADRDAHLSVLMLYALAIGAAISFTVRPFEEHEQRKAAER